MKGNGKENRLPKLCFQNYTLLNTSLHKILDDVKVMEFLNLFERKIPLVKDHFDFPILFPKKEKAK